MAALEYLASDSHQLVVARTLGCSQQTISNAIDRVINGLSSPEIVERFVQFPHTNESIRREKEQFAAMARFPGCKCLA